jgi:hypothetical protein
MRKEARRIERARAQVFHVLQAGSYGRLRRADSGPAPLVGARSKRSCACTPDRHSSPVSTRLGHELADAPALKFSRRTFPLKPRDASDTTEVVRSVFPTPEEWALRSRSSLLTRNAEHAAVDRANATVNAHQRSTTATISRCRGTQIASASGRCWPIFTPTPAIAVWYAPNRLEYDQTSSRRRRTGGFRRSRISPRRRCVQSHRR